MNCIICDNTADEVGSHLIPASLIKNCIGKHYSEESFNIDSKTSKIDTFYGRDNLNNQSTEIKQNHYKRDHILCKICEKKLAELESKFAAEFLQKFRVDKYLANFNSYKSSSDLEILEPKKILNIEIQAYFYSIILRFCYIFKFEGGDSYIEEYDLLKIKIFLYNFLYANITDKEHGIENFRIAIIFNKYSTNSAFISTSDKLKNPYIFYFCEAILVLYIEENKATDKSLFFDCLNSITDNTSKIIVGPSLMYEKFTSLISNILAENFMTNGIKYITELNKKSFEENEIEVKKLIEKYDKDDKGIYITKIFETLKKKYSS